jgi:hypothetical protein
LGGWAVAARHTRSLVSRQRGSGLRPGRGIPAGGVARRTRTKPDRRPRPGPAGLRTPSASGTGRSDRAPRTGAPAVPACRVASLGTSGGRSSSGATRGPGRAEAGDRGRAAGISAQPFSAGNRRARAASATARPPAPRARWSESGWSLSFPLSRGKTGATPKPAESQRLTGFRRGFVWCRPDVCPVGAPVEAQVQGDRTLDGVWPKEKSGWAGRKRNPARRSREEEARADGRGDESGPNRGARTSECAFPAGCDAA